MKRLLLPLAIALLATPAFADDAARVCPRANAETAKALGATSSRYIGETEKNLEFAFAGATATVRAHALSFDEADALFGRDDQEAANDPRSRAEYAYLRGYRGEPEALEGFPRRAFVSGFRTRSGYGGTIVLEAEKGVRILDFNGVFTYDHAVTFARDFVKVCGRG
jgi:hypothetical protein